jgi:virulence factor Mce-like protein
MRRVGLAITFAAILAGALLLLLAGGGRSFRVAAIFDTADGIVVGQQVKIAGSVVGSVDQVALAGGRGPIKARIVMSIDPRFGPFRRNATCTILPQGLISENFVQCDPGSSRAAKLTSGAGGVPTVPLAHTTVPASLQDLVDVFSLPTDDRLRVIINELGIATAGRGADLNALLERSNPALTQAQRALAIIAAQRQQLAIGIAQTAHVLTAVASKRQGVREFVDRAATVARTTAAHQTALAQAIHRLPALLGAVRPGLASLDRAIARGTPLLDSLRTAAPGLITVTYTLPSFVAAGTPALTSLASASATGRSAVRAAYPVVGDLERAAAQAGPFAANLDQLLISTRNSGGIEGLLGVFYGMANLVAAYDRVSHKVSLTVDALPICVAITSAKGCSSKYDAPGNGTIPPSDPACGPQNGAPWDPPTSCVSTVLPLIRKHSRLATHTPRPASRVSRTGPEPLSRTPTTSAPVPATPTPVRIPPIPALGATGPVSTTLNGLVHVLHFLLGQ